MNQKTIAIIAVCLAVIGAGVSCAVVMNKRAVAAQARADEAAARADEAKAKARAAEKSAAAAADQKAAADANVKAAAEQAAAAKSAVERAELERQAAAEQKAKAAENSRAEQAKADAARAARDEAKAKAEQARAEAAAAKEKAAEAAAKEAEAEARLAIEKQKSEKVIAEAKLLELRKIEFEQLARSFAEWKADLEERERALRPEKTISDLSWAGGMEDTIIDEKGNVKKQEKGVYDPEKDMSLPAGTRQLARAERLAGEDLAKRTEKVRDSLVSTLDGLRRQALAEGRVIDADFYGKSIESLYPGWKPDAAGKNQENKEDK